MQTSQQVRRDRSRSFRLRPGGNTVASESSNARDSGPRRAHMRDSGVTTDGSTSDSSEGTDERLLRRVVARAVRKEMRSRATNSDVQRHKHFHDHSYSTPPNAFPGAFPPPPCLNTWVMPTCYPGCYYNRPSYGWGASSLSRSGFLC